jgi:hypothetical protein
MLLSWRPCNGDASIAIVEGFDNLQVSIKRVFNIGLEPLLWVIHTHCIHQLLGWKVL